MHTSNKNLVILQQEDVGSFEAVFEQGILDHFAHSRRRIDNRSIRSGYRSAARHLSRRYAASKKGPNVTTNTQVDAAMEDWRIVMRG